MSFQLPKRGGGVDGEQQEPDEIQERVVGEGRTFADLGVHGSVRIES
jgi:hypothetical protein